MSISNDPMSSIEKAQKLFEKGPETAVAAFFAIAFFVSILFLLRSKDKHLLDQAKLQKEHAIEIANLNLQSQERAIKMELTLHGLLQMMEPLRIIAMEMKAKQRRRSQVDPTAVTSMDVVAAAKEGGSDTSGKR